MSLNLFFWKGSFAKQVVIHLQLIGRQIKKLNEFGLMKKEAIKTTYSIKREISEAKKNIAEKSAEEKHNPLLTAEQDRVVDALAADELHSLDALNDDLDSYQELLQGSVTMEELNEVIGLFQEEEETILRREKENEARVKAMKEQTLRIRLARPSSSVPGLRTKDGVKWNDIVRVAKELGGTVQKTSGRHSYEITFPKASRPVALSEDVTTTALAKQIREQLFHSFPPHKIPNTTKLRRALTSGDIHGSM
ncbi:MAG TPA: hypothetical protein VJH68_03130 [Candidatus Nanoarchaeia archaeon]|nr:hypothetical protein [Candidatus Nanoarchaeia archaeon]